MQRGILVLVVSVVFMLVTACRPDGIDVNDQTNQFLNETSNVDAYLKSISVTPEIDRNSLLRHVITKQGSNLRLLEEDIITMSYKGVALGKTLPFGSQDSLRILVRDISLPSWRVALSKVGEGGKVTIYSPSLYAYGTRGVDSLVAANETVVFEIELIDVSREGVENQDVIVKEQLKVEVEAIDSFLKANSIDAKIDSASSIRYVIKKQGSKVRPAFFSNLVVNYSGKVIGEDRVIDSGAGFEFPMGKGTRRSVIDGWRIGLPYIGEGGSIDLYIPSFYAYGTNRRGELPGNSTLVFEIELLEVR